MNDEPVLETESLNAKLQAAQGRIPIQDAGEWNKKFCFQDFAGKMQNSEEMEAFIDWCRFPWWP